MTRLWELADHLLGQARMIQALTTLVIGTAALSPLIARLAGWWGLGAILAVLVALCAGSLWSMRLELEVRWVPLTLAAFVAFATASILWSRYPLAALLGVLALLAFSFLGAYVALARDISQIVRAFGGVARAVLAGSFAIEMLTGIVMDMPLPGIGVHGNLIRLGPIQGLVGRADVLGLLMVLAIATFAVEMAMRSLSVPAGVLWTLAAIGMLLVTRSTAALVLGIVAGLAIAAIAFIRAAPPHLRTGRQVGVVLSAVALAVVAWAARWPLAEALGGAAEVRYRTELWRQVLGLFDVQSQQLQGRGFVGRWNLDVVPYSQFQAVQSRPPIDASSAYVDALFQLGAIGLGLLLLALAAALGRSWLLASRKRAVVYVWPAIVLAIVVASGLAMSQMLFELGWLLVVVCAVKASHEISWRRALDAVRPPG